MKCQLLLVLILFSVVGGGRAQSQALHGTIPRTDETSNAIQELIGTDLREWQNATSLESSISANLIVCAESLEALANSDSKDNNTRILLSVMSVYARAALPFGDNEYCDHIRRKPNKAWGEYLRVAKQIKDNAKSDDELMVYYKSLTPIWLMKAYELSGREIGPLYSDEYRNVFYNELSNTSNDLQKISIYEYLICVAIHIDYQEACKLAEELYHIEKHFGVPDNRDYNKYIYSAMQSVYEVFERNLVNKVRFIRWGINELDKNREVDDILNSKDESLLWNELQNIIPQYMQNAKNRTYCRYQSSFEDAPFNKIPGITLEKWYRKGDDEISVMYTLYFWDNWRGIGLDGMSPWLLRRNERAKEIKDSNDQSSEDK